VFGLQELFRDGPRIVFLRPPGTHDTITSQQHPDACRGTGNIEHFGFRLADRRQQDRPIEEVTAAGGTRLERGEHQAGSSHADVTDPDGHMIEL
jgi:catechol 2,3-dioxygenase-like lactoylglutathione lyase family enzyme